jgi:hypothetical protein
VDASYQRLEREFLKLARKNGLLREKKSDPTGKPEKP